MVIHPHPGRSVLQIPLSESYMEPFNVLKKLKITYSQFSGKHKLIHVLVGVGMMSVVLDSPGFEWVHQWHKHHCPDNVIDKLILGKRIVSGIMTDNKKASHRSPKICIDKWIKIPWWYCKGSISKSHRSKGDSHSLPGFHVIDFENLK